MGWIQDALKELQLSPVMRERVALAEQKYAQAVAEAEEGRRRVAELEKEVAELRAQLPSKPADGLDDATCQVLVYLFRCRGENCDVGVLAQRLQMERGIAEYHLDQLNTRGLAKAQGGNYVTGAVYWGPTPEGRSYVVENGLISNE